MNNIAIIPARCGSKGIKDKNIKLINGKPLIAYTIEAAIKSCMFNEVMVSTDSEIYAEIAKSYNAKVPFMRSSNSSTDTSSSWDVVKEVLIQYSNLGNKFDTFALLQPTSPLRNNIDIVNSYSVFRSKNANAVVSICETDYPIDICNYIGNDQSLDNFYDAKKYKPRQIFKKMYRLNGAIYISKVNTFFSQNSIYDNRCYAYIMKKINSIDIDDEEDFFIASSVLMCLNQNMFI